MAEILTAQQGVRYAAFLTVFFTLGAIAEAVVPFEAKGISLGGVAQSCLLLTAGLVRPGGKTGD